MCGIIGCASRKPSAPYLIKGLKALEYRGYDSAGLATEEETGIEIIKAVGKVAALEAEAENHILKGVTGVAHTRWATHGKPTKANSHPISDCSGDVIVVHNGIIENYITFKDELLKRGHKFRSETDTEVVAHLLEEKLSSPSENREKDFLEAVGSVAALLEGSYALTVMWKGAPGVIIGARKKSPLIAGIGKGENFLGSDVSAFRPWAHKAVYMDDGDMAVIKKDSIKLYDFAGNEKKYEAKELEKSFGEAGKNGLEHYMLKEIREQPVTLQATIESLLDDMNFASEKSPQELENISNIMIVGCGTAYHAAMTASYWIEEFCDVPAQAELASEYKYKVSAAPSGTAAVFVSQSGETADTVAALEKASASGFRTLSVCNVYGSAIPRLSGRNFFTKCGPEISVASTKAFTSQLAALFSLSVLLGKSRGNIGREKERELLSHLKNIPVAAEEALKEESVIKDLAEKYHRKKSFVFLGRNVNYPIALEGALKLKEITYLQAEGFAAGEIKHGPIALLDEGVPVVAVMPGDRLFDKMMNACEEVMARGAIAIAITDKKGKELIDGRVKDVIVLPETLPSLFPIPAVIVLQLFAYWVARFNGREIDQPRNLAKSVTVE